MTIAAIALCGALGPIRAPFVFGLSQMLASAVVILTLTAMGIVTAMPAGPRLQPA